VSAPPAFILRSAEPQDIPGLFGLILALAEYEKLAHDVVSTPDQLAAALFGPSPKVFCELAVCHGETVGMAIWFYTFSTFAGRHGIWLEDLYVLETFRGKGIGKALLKRLAQICVAQNLARLEWTVLDWNAPSIQFYKAMGAKLMEEWTNCRLTGEALKKLAEV